MHVVVSVVVVDTNVYMRTLMLTFNWPKGDVNLSWAQGTVDDVALTFQLHKKKKRNS